MLMMKNIKDIVTVIIEEKVPVVTTGAGTPKHIMPYLKEAGIKVIPVIASVKHAQKMEELGVDAVIAEGSEAGGHIERPIQWLLSRKSLMRYQFRSLLPEVWQMAEGWLLRLP